VFRQLTVALLIGFLIVGPVGAQFKLRALSGLVTDIRGNPLSRVAVELENTRSQSVRSYITGNDGKYYFGNLSDDVDFTVKAKYRSFWSRRKNLSKFNPSIHPEVNLVIPID